MQWFVVYQDGEPVAAFFMEDDANDYLQYWQRLLSGPKGYASVFEVKCQTITITESEQ